jgi:phenylalanyl-tRNA synthetase beta chain
MRVPLKWLRDYVNVSLPLKELAERLTMAGAEVKRIEPVSDHEDAILDLDITPNRPDCLSMIGIAREVAALTQQEVHIPSIEYEELGSNIDHLVSVEILDSDLCRRYCASLIEGIKVGSSPPWMQERLLAYGMRPINNIVDITNYVMLEHGQPLHAFDLHKIKEGRIKVRRARGGETITTLDGIERVLATSMLVIADAELPVAVAGVMGGAESEVTEGTTSVLLESANFHPVNIRRTSQSLVLPTEASLRFEKGISSELAPLALRCSTQLILELAGGKAARGIIDVYPCKVKREPILLSTSQVNHLLGMELSLEQVREALTSLGFECQPRSPSELRVQVPYWRTDVTLAADLIEEVARIIGYERIPTTLLSSSLPRQQPDPALSLRERIRDILVGCGFQEVISYSLISRERVNKPPSLHIANPMSREQEYLRVTLCSNLLSILSSNQKHEEGGIRIFEIGKIYLPREKDLPQEREMLMGVISGPRSERTWLGEERHLDFFDAKGIVETLMKRLRVEMEFERGEDEGLHPGRMAKIEVRGDRVGLLGELHPKVAESFDLLPYPVSLFEIDMDKLLPHIVAERKYQPLSHFPSSVRDIALVVDEEMPVKKIGGIIQSFPLVSQVTLFDLYAGKQVPPGKRSLAFRIVYQSPTHTLTDEEVNEIERQILAELSQELGATLRT